MVEQKGFLKNELNNFTQKIVSLKNSYPLVFISMDRYSKFIVNKYNELLNKRGEKKITGTKTSYIIQYKNIEEIEELSKKIKQIDDSFYILQDNYIISLVSIFDGYMSQIFTKLIATKHDILRTSDKQISFKDLYEFDSIKNTKEFLIIKEVESLSRKSHVEQLKWLNEKFKINLQKKISCWPDFIEMIERRHLFVHNSGIINDKYIKNCRVQKVNLKKSLKPGIKLLSDKKYFLNSYNCIFETGVKIGQLMWRNLFPDELEVADTNLIDISYDLLKNKEYKLAKIMLDFSTNLEKYHNEETRRYLIINHAIAYKLSKNNKKCKDILNKEDWSAVEDKFKLAEAVLTDNYNKAVALMRVLGKNNKDINEAEYKNFPLFDKFRKTKQFKNAYKEIFKEDFVIEENKKHAS